MIFRLLKVIFLITLGASFIFSQEEDPFPRDSFWEGNVHDPFQNEFTFKKKNRLEDTFGPIGYGFFRFFAVGVGTAPIAYLVGSQVYDWSVYAAKGGDSYWQPGFYGWENSRLTKEERRERAWNVTGVVIGTSLLVAVIDTMLYHLLYSPKAKEKRGIKI